MARGGSERFETKIEIINDQKLSPSLRDDISSTGSRIGINENAFQREKFRASNGVRLVDRKSVSTKLQRFKIFSVLYNRFYSSSKSRC